MADEIVLPREARRALLVDHSRIRLLLDELVGLAERVETGEHIGRRFPAVVGQLRRALEAHNAAEEAALGPLLRGLDAEHMLAEHREEHISLLVVLDVSDELALARAIPSFAATLREHMDREERGFLASDALRDGPHGEP
jgi:hemerythrin superfamily protein